MKVSVFGLGYVGSVSAACLADAGHTVIGVDTNETKVEAIRAGQSPVLEPGMPEIVARAVADGRLRATTSPAEAIAESEISLVCVGTPSRANGSLDTKHIERVSTQIGEALRDKAARHIVVIRSTVLPGTLESIVVPALERASGKTLGTGFGVAANPEFLREGTSIRDFYDPPFTIVGSPDHETAQAVASLYPDLEAPTFLTDLRTAEMLKYVCNCYHALKVSFANEVGNLCKAQGIDSHEVMRLFTADTKLNISTAYLKPGYAFGGSCLPKDLRALTHRARQLDVRAPVLDAVLETNRLQVERAATMILNTGHQSVGMLGLSFKEGTDDLRESPLVALAEILIGKGRDLSIYDAHVTKSALLGTNRAYIEEHIPHIWSLMREQPAEVIAHAQTVVIGSREAAIQNAVRGLDSGKVVVDLVRAVEPAELSATYDGISW